MIIIRGIIVAYIDVRWLEIKFVGTTSRQVQELKRFL